MTKELFRVNLFSTLTKFPSLLRFPSAKALDMQIAADVWQISKWKKNISCCWQFFSDALEFLTKVNALTGKFYQSHTNINQNQIKTGAKYSQQGIFIGKCVFATNAGYHTKKIENKQRTLKFNYSNPATIAILQ